MVNGNRRYFQQQSDIVMRRIIKNIDKDWAPQQSATVNDGRTSFVRAGPPQILYRRIVEPVYSYMDYTNGQEIYVIRQFDGTLKQVHSDEIE